MTARLGVGLVGAGRIAELHIAALRSLGIPLVGVVSSTPNRSRDAVRRFGAGRSYDDLDAMLADSRIDVVHITSPTALHVHQVEQALLAGKLVVCEKPLTTSVEDSQRLCLLAESMGLVGTVAYSYRFRPLASEFRTRRSVVGRPLSMHASFRQEWLLTAAADE